MNKKSRNHVLEFMIVKNDFLIQKRSVKNVILNNTKKLKVIPNIETKYFGKILTIRGGTWG